MQNAPNKADVTVIMVSFNTRDLTVAALETLFANAGNVNFDVILWDNASTDGSAEAIAERFPHLIVMRSAENLGFGMPHNILAKQIETEWMLLLNSDTETHPSAVENLLHFAKQNPDASIVGGRTVFRDGSLNPTSCWNRMTLWSLFCQSIGLSRVFPDSPFFNVEGIGGWKRDTVRQVDIVTGCLFLLRTETWRTLGGFQSRYFMYGEETDMCLRAGKLGMKLMITPDAQIMHLGGASAQQRSSRIVQVLRSKASLIKDHWQAPLVPFGLGLLWLGIGLRLVGAKLFGTGGSSVSVWQEVWSARRSWLGGYQ